MKHFIILCLLLVSLFPSENLIKNSTDIVTDGKPVMLIFTSQTCPYCEVFAKDLHENEALNALAKGMNIYEIKRDVYKEYTLWGKPTNLKTLEMTFAVKVTPNIVIFDKMGRKIWQIPGYADPALMIPYLKFVHGIDNGTYKITQWEAYLREEGIIK
jgi:thioredoxin-related protein